MIGQRIWRDTEEDNDRMRRKEAEFLIKTHVPSSCIFRVIVRDVDTKEYVLKIMENEKISKEIYIDYNNKYVYP